MTDKRFTSLFFDPKDENIYLGGADGFGISRPDIQAMNQPERPILLTALYINNQLMSPHTGESIPNIRYTNSIELAYNQNNLAFELSDLPYSLEEKHEFVYQLEGMDKEWNFLKSNTNRITYSNLNYGDYQLIISKVEKEWPPVRTSLYFEYQDPASVVLYGLGKGDLCSFVPQPHHLDNQFLPRQEPVENGTYGERRFWNSHARKWLSSATYPMS